MEAPYLHVAFVCGSIPKDGKMPVENLPGKVDVEGDPETIEQASFNLPLTLFLAFTSGDYTGKAIIVVQPVTPSGRKLSVLLPAEIEFENALNHRVNIKMIMENLPIQETGVYWFDVKLNGYLMTRVPLEITYRQRPRPSSPPSKKKQTHKKKQIGFEIS